MRFDSRTNRRRKLRVFTAALGGLLTASAVCAHDYEAGELRIGHPSTRATPLPGATAIGYLEIDNHGAKDDTLLGARSDAAAQIEIHQMSEQNGIARMRALDKGLSIPAHASVDLSPEGKDGYHLMLIGVKRQLQAGERVPVTLNFARAGAVKVEFEVEALAP